MKITVTAIPDTTDSAGLDGTVDAVQSTAVAGFERIWLPQLPPSAGSASWDAITALAVAGAMVPSIEVGTGVAVAHGQHPLTLARQALTASAATGGRFILGLGVSHRFLVSDMLGYDYDSPAAFFREYLEVLLPALAAEPVNHHGQRITAVGQLTLPKAPAPTVVAAALGPRMLRLAGELTSGTITSWTGPKALEKQIIPTITQAAHTAHRPAPQIIVGLPVAVTRDVAGAHDQISAALGYGDLPAYRAMLDIEGVDSAADICVFGDEDYVLSQLGRFADIGVTEFTAFIVGDAATRTRTFDLLAENTALG